MKQFLILIFLILLGSHWVQAQDLGMGQKAKEDSTGLVNSSLLPTVAPLLLFDDQKVKEEKKVKKKNARKSTYFGIKTRKGSTRRSLRAQLPLGKAIPTFVTDTGMTQRNGPSEPKDSPKAKATSSMDPTNVWSTKR